MSGEDTPAPDVSATQAALRDRLARQQQRGTTVAPDEPEADDFDEDDDQADDETTANAAAAGPARSIGRAGKGMATVPVYAPIVTMDALFQLADDVYFGTRGRVNRWEIIDAVIRVGLTAGQKRRILARLAPQLAAQLVPDKPK